MIAVLFVWFLLLFVFWALGDSILYLFNRTVDSNYRLSTVQLFFIGLCAAQIIASIFSLFFPLNSFLFTGILLFTALYWLVARKRLVTLLKKTYRWYGTQSLLGKGLLMSLILIVLYHSASFSVAPDEFLYHLQGIKWLQEYGVVKGLANLHTRFGFNSSALSIFGLFGYQPDLKISFTPLNGLCMFVFVVWSIQRISKTKNSIEKIVHAIALLLMIHFFAMELSSTSTDIIVNILVVYLILSCLFSKDPLRLFLPLAILPALCVTLKLSAAPIAIISIYIYVFLFRHKMLKQLGFVLIVSALIVLPWIIQNCLLSGYVVFPFPSIDLFSFDWKVPLAITAEEKALTYNWARGIVLEESNHSLLSWVPMWFRSIALINKIIYLLAAFAIMISMAMFRPSRQSKLFALGFITAIAGTLFGFATAPELRFSIGFTLMTCLMPLAWLSLKELNHSLVFKGVFYVSVITFLAFHIQYIGYKVYELAKMDTPYLKSQLIKPFPVSYATQRSSFEIVKINNVDVYLPHNGFCADHTLPCAPKIVNNLELRGEDIGEGFRIKK